MTRPTNMNNFCYNPPSVVVPLHIHITLVHLISQLKHCSSTNQASSKLFQSLDISDHPYAHIHVVYWGGSAAGVGRPLSNTHASDRLLSLLCHFHGFIACSLSYPHLAPFEPHTQYFSCRKIFLINVFNLYFMGWFYWELPTFMTSPKYRRYS